MEKSKKKVIIEGKPRGPLFLPLFPMIFIIPCFLLIGIIFWPGLMGMLIGVLFILATGGLLFLIALRMTHLRKLVIDHIGVRLYIIDREIWSVLWKDIHTITSKSWIKPNFAYIGFTLKTASKTIRVDDKNHLGPVKNLNRAYKEIVQRAAGPNVLIEDTLGWAADVDLRGRLTRPKAPINLKSIIGQWHDFLDNMPPSRIGKFMFWAFLSTAVLLILVGIILFIFTEKGRELIFLVLFPVAIFSLFMASIYPLANRIGAWMTPIAVLFDGDHIEVKFSSGKVWKDKWANVEEVRLFAETGLLAFKLKDRPFRTVGPLPIEVVNTIYETYWSAKLAKRPKARS